MIWLYRSRSRVGSYKTFEDVCDSFVRLERFKAMDQGSFDPSYPGAFPERWDFSYIPCTQLCRIVDSLRTNARLTGAERKAYEDELDLLEMCAGDPQTLQQIVLFPDVDVEELARDWCFAYAHAKNFSLFEGIDGTGAALGEKHSPAALQFSAKHPLTERNRE